MPAIARSQLELYGIPGGFGGVGAAGWGGPAVGAVGELVDVPSGVLLEPVVVAALGAGREILHGQGRCGWVIVLTCQGS